jgi:DNA-binding GntR family transcriptional regulator
MPRLGILYEQHIQIVEALNQRDVELCTELIQSHADIDYEAMNLLAKAGPSKLIKLEPQEIGMNNENN